MRRVCFHPDDPHRAELPRGRHPAARREASEGCPGVSGVKLDLVFDPPWTKNMMSEAARLQLGIEDVIPIARISSMKLTSHEEYGLRCLIRLGQEGLEAD